MLSSRNGLPIFLSLSLSLSLSLPPPPPAALSLSLALAFALSLTHSLTEDSRIGSTVEAYRPRFFLQKSDLLHALMSLSLGLTPNLFSPAALPGSGDLLPQQQLQQMQQSQAMSQKLLLEQRVCAHGLALCQMCVYHM